MTRHWPVMFGIPIDFIDMHSQHTYTRRVYYGNIIKTKSAIAPCACNATTVINQQIYRRQEQQKQIMSKLICEMPETQYWVGHAMTKMCIVCARWTFFRFAHLPVHSYVLSQQTKLFIELKTQNKSSTLSINLSASPSIKRVVVDLSKWLGFVKSYFCACRLSNIIFHCFFFFGLLSLVSTMNSCCAVYTFRWQHIHRSGEHFVLSCLSAII